jgi:hypothetical protein
MEKEIIQSQENVEINEDMKISRAGLRSLLSIAGWAKFIAIIGLLFLIFLVIFGFSFGTTLAKLSSYSKLNVPGTFFSIIFGVTYLIMGAIYFYPLWALLKFSNLAKKAIARNDENLLAKALSFLKGHYTYIGVLTIIGLIFLVFEIIFVIIAASASSSIF